MSNIKCGIAKTKEEFESLKKLCRDVFNEEVKQLADDLFYKSPKKQENVYFYAYDQQEDKYVGVLCLIDVSLKCSGVKIKTAEYGIAGTVEDYQGQGINQQLTELFFKQCEEKNYQLVVIEGIPYFYRRYSFNYAVPMTNQSLDLTEIDIESKDNLKIRQAREEDVKFIATSHQQAAKNADLVKYKEEEIIRAQLLEYKSNPVSKEYLIIEKAEARLGYLTLEQGEELKISDITDNLTFKDYQSVLAYFKKQGETKLVLDIPSEAKFSKLLSNYGATIEQWYSWQIKIMDQFEFLQNIKAVLKNRIKNSIYETENLEFYYDNFKELIKISLEEGKISLEREERTEAKWDFNLTPQGATKLFLGEQNMTEINNFLPDCQVSEQYRDLANLLFPKLEAHFYTNY